jgi:hypothetical protein
MSRTSRANILLAPDAGTAKPNGDPAGIARAICGGGMASQALSFAGHSAGAAARSRSRKDGNRVHPATAEVV